MTNISLFRGHPSQGQSFASRRFRDVRAQTEAICSRLELEDYVVQPAPFVSPPKWHLAHCTWFFDCFVLQDIDLPRPQRIAAAGLMFNSYYKSQGEHWAQQARGQLSRPTVREVLAWRAAVTEEIGVLLETCQLTEHQLSVLEIGIQHEQQHQELLLMDIKYILGMHPVPPAYAEFPTLQNYPQAPLHWFEAQEGFCEIGADADGFAFDNERPRHKRWLNAHAVASRLITNGEFLEFIADAGYRRPELWLSDGWDWIQHNGVSHPLYWREQQGSWTEYHLTGPLPLQRELPVSHVSYYEADAFARWYGARLPDEFELENFLQHHDSGSLEYPGWLPGAPLHPVSAADPADHTMLWQWTTSAYSAYPGYVPERGALGEYNSKFMCNQFVLRGGCFATPPGHLRHSYRNFYRAFDRWAFTGIRLARTLV